MIEARLTDLDYNEILSYMGASRENVPPEEMERVINCAALVRSAARPALVYRRVRVEEESEGFDCGGLRPAGSDIRRVLSGCRWAVLFAATVGHRVDKLINRLQVTDMAEAVIADACASAAVENVCDNFESDMRKLIESEGLFLSERFSPGYGDLPITTQRELGEFLNCRRRIGVSVSENCLMTPIKSVTAIMGISREKKPCVIRGCSVCAAREDCAVRKARETNTQDE